VWQPFWSAPLGGNAQAQESFATLANRWQDFVGRRLKEDFSLVQRLARCATPDQVMAAYADFWSKAAQDYGNEIATLSKIIGGATTGMTAAAQSTPREVSAEIYRAGRAA
jgi:phasin protein